MSRRRTGTPTLASNRATRRERRAGSPGRREGSRGRRRRLSPVGRLRYSSGDEPCLDTAERVGFEPTRLTPTAFRERHLQPLGHLSGSLDSNEAEGAKRLSAEGLAHERLDLSTARTQAHLGPMVEPWIVQDLEHGARGAGLLVRSAVHDEIDAGLLRRPGAHRTRLDRDV